MRKNRKKYGRYFYRHNPVSVDPLCEADIERAISGGKNSSAGPDGLLPQDLKMVPQEGREMLADLLNTVERLHKWPVQFRAAKATCLAKNEDQGPFADPLQQRILLVTRK